MKQQDSEGGVVKIFNYMTFRPWARPKCQIIKLLHLCVNPLFLNALRICRRLAIKYMKRNKFSRPNKIFHESKKRKVTVT